MSEVQNNLGEKFKETIAEAMKTGDFHALNTLVTDTVNDALREADFQANLSREATEKKVWNSQRSWQDKRREEVKTEAEIQAERQQREKQQEERRRQHPEQVLVLLADSVSFPEKLQQTLNEQFGVAYTPVSIPETNTFADEALLYAGKLEPGGLLERVKEAKTVILVSPRLELLRRIASGDDGDPLSHLLVRAILWQKDVRVYLDYEPPRFRRNTFLADTAEAIDTLRQMAVTVCPYFAVAPQEPEGTDLVTEADVLDAAKTESKTIRCRSGAIITPAARDALAATDVILRYEGETTHAAS